LHQGEIETMDALSVAVVLLFFVLTLGLLVVCERLQEG
jgi:hypothetical protein